MRNPGAGSIVSFERIAGGVASFAITAAAADAVALHIWHHVVGTYDGAKLKLFVDGTMRSSTADTRPQSPKLAPFVVGAKGNNASTTINGVLDEVAVYDRALPAARVLVHYNAGLGP